jgi:hypothetical protein
MRSLLAAVFLVASAVIAQAGVLVQLTDGTTLTVESHWSDGNQVHLVRGGVDMIVPKANIKSMNEDVADPEVGGAASGEARSGAPRQDETPGMESGGETEPAEPDLSQLSAAELEAIHVAESDRLLELQDKRFTSKYDRNATPEARQAAADAFVKQNKRNAAVWFALDKARKAEAAAAAPAAPAVVQPQ